MVSIKKIAEESGYSQATVSRLLRGDESLSITKNTKDKILSTALSLGYDRHRINLPIGKIALLFGISLQEEFQDLYFHNLRLAIEKHAKLSKLEVITVSNISEIKKISSETTSFIALGSFDKDDVSLLKEFFHYGVFLEINPDPDNFDTVKPDTNRITSNAISLFIQKGYNNIGFFGGGFFDIDQKIYQMDSREVEFRRVLYEHNLLKEKFIFSGGNFSVKTGYNLAKKSIALLDKNFPDAFFISSDTIAVGVLQAFNEESITVPDIFEIISVNDSEIAKFTSPPLSTYKIDIDEISKSAIDLLIDQFNFPRSTTKTILLGSELVIRKSFKNN